jgi:type IV secretion system protein VirB11
MVDLHPDDRFVTIEDTREIQCTAENKVELGTHGNFDMQSLLRLTLRLTPTRIIVGEVRGREALTMLKAWNTGHPGGVATVHANSALAGLTRIEQLISEAMRHPRRDLIAEAINVIIFISKTSRGRQIDEIIEVKGFDGKYDTTQVC